MSNYQMVTWEMTVMMEILMPYVFTLLQMNGTTGTALILQVLMDPVSFL